MGIQIARGSILERSGSADAVSRDCLRGSQVRILSGARIPLNHKHFEMD
jgi:hypothetical protein